MKRFLLAFTCLLGFFASTTFFGNDLADDAKPEITSVNPADDII